MFEENWNAISGASCFENKNNEYWMYVLCFVFDFWLFGWNIWFVLILCETKSKHETKSWFIVLCSVIGYAMMI